MTEPVKISILDREYLIACPEEERQGLLRSAELLNQKMQDIRDKGKVIGMDRIAILAALNLTHELLQAKPDNGGLDEISSRLAALNSRVAKAVS